MNVKKIIATIIKIIILTICAYGLCVWVIIAAIKEKPAGHFTNSTSVQESIDSGRFVALFVPVKDGVSDSLAKAHWIKSMLIEKQRGHEFLSRNLNTLVFFPVAAAPYGGRSIECVVDNIPWTGRKGQTYYHLMDTTDLYQDTICVHFATPYRRTNHPFGVMFRRVPLDELR